MDYIRIAYSFLFKIIFFKKGGLFLGSTCISTGLTYYFSIIFKGVEVRDILLTIFIEGIFLFLFSTFSFIDLITGIQASFFYNSQKKYPLPSNRVIRSSKLWRTFWKSFGVVMLTLMLTFLSIISILMKSSYTNWAFTWALITFWIMTCSFEFYSIGENLAKRNNGEKPKIFGFFDKILDAIQRKAIKSIDSSFNILEDDKAKRDL